MRQRRTHVTVRKDGRVTDRIALCDGDSLEIPLDFVVVFAGNTYRQTHTVTIEVLEKERESA